MTYFRGVERRGDSIVVQFSSSKSTILTEAILVFFVRESRGKEHTPIFIGDNGFAELLLISSGCLMLEDYFNRREYIW